MLQKAYHTKTTDIISEFIQTTAEHSFTAAELSDFLKKHGLEVNKTTIYRNLDKLTENDTFSITVLDEVLEYEVDEINTVLPHEMDKLAPVPDMDCVTLMTCTPYGINTHRLLVRAHRIDRELPHVVKIPADAVPADELKVLPFIVIPVLICLVMYWSFTGRRDKNKRKNLKKR